MQAYWNCFQHVYLATLREHHMYNSNRKTSKNVLKVGDVAIIKDDKVSPRNSWRMGRVESLVVGRDNNVRGAIMNTRSNEGKRT